MLFRLSAAFNTNGLFSQMIFFIWLPQHHTLLVSFLPAGYSFIYPKPLLQCHRAQSSSFLSLPSKHHLSYLLLAHLIPLDNLNTNYVMIIPASACQHTSYLQIYTSNHQFVGYLDIQHQLLLSLRIMVASFCWFQQMPWYHPWLLFSLTVCIQAS